MPGVKSILRSSARPQGWLDVDDMRSKRGPAHRRQASTVIDGVQVDCSLTVLRDGEGSRLLQERACMHELGRAQQQGTPVIFVLETASTRASRPKRIGATAQSIFFLCSISARS